MSGAVVGLDDLNALGDTAQLGTVIRLAAVIVALRRSPDWTTLRESALADLQSAVEYAGVDTDRALSEWREGRAGEP